MRLTHKLILLLATTSFVTNTSPALARNLWEPPTRAISITSSRPTVAKEMVASLRIATVPIVLEKTTLTEIRAQLGGKIGQRGDAGEFLQWLCYTGSNTGSHWILWLESSEIEGGTVGGLELSRMSSAEKADERCSQLPNGAGVELPNALHLGMNANDLQASLGKPTTTHGETLIFTHEQQETIHGESYTSSNTVTFILRGTAVWTINVWKLTSN